MSPVPSTQQSQMDTINGMAPVLDSNGVIDDISFKMNVITKVADYTVKASESGSIFTTYGATAAVNFTLPSKADGLCFYFFSAADVGMTVTADAVDTIVTFNDIAADTVAISTASNIIGSGFLFVSDGTVWFAIPLIANGGSLPAPMTVTT